MPPLALIVHDLKIRNSKKEKLLGITTDSDLIFQFHGKIPCKKTSSMIPATFQVDPYIDIRQGRMIMCAFFNSRFGYRPVLSMFYGRMANNEMIKFHKRCLRITYTNKSLSCEVLLEKMGLFSYIAESYVAMLTNGKGC